MPAGGWEVSGIVGGRKKGYLDEDQARPPLGMGYTLGQTVVYEGEIEELRPDALKIGAPYPTSGRYKTIEIPRPDIQSLHVARPSPG